MKGRRQAYLLQLIKEREIETQDELLQHLHSAGFLVTQATISRDIKELRLVKIADGKGGYRYALQQGAVKGDLNRRARRVFEDYVRGIDFSENLLIIKTYPGGANAVAAVIDDLEWEGVVASLAGDDVILLVVRSEVNAKQGRPQGLVGELYTKLEDLLHRVR